MKIFYHSCLAALFISIVTQGAMAENLRPKGSPRAWSNDNFALELAAPYYPQGFGNDEILSFLTELNEDDADNELVIELGNRYCNHSGCRVLILQDDGTSDHWWVIFDHTVSSMESLEKRTKGWADLKVITEGQREKIYIYDGKTYVLSHQ